MTINFESHQLADHNNIKRYTNTLFLIQMIEFYLVALSYAGTMIISIKNILYQQRFLHELNKLATICNNCIDKTNSINKIKIYQKFTYAILIGYVLTQVIIVFSL